MTSLTLSAVCYAPWAHATTTFVDNSVQAGDGDGYYVVFFVRPSGADPKHLRDVLSGYLFIGFGVENKIKGLGRFEAFGLYPDQTRPGQRALFGPIPEEIAEEETPALQEILPRVPKEISGRAPYDHANSLILKVDKSAWDSAYDIAKAEMAAASKWRSPPVKYKIFVLDCVTWFAQQVVNLGLKVSVPDATSSGSWLPSSILQEMIDANVGHVDHAKYAGGTTWTGSTFQGMPHGPGTMAWPNGSFVGLAKRGHPAKGITQYEVGDCFEGAYGAAGELLSGVYKWRSGAQFDGKYVDGKESDGTYTTADGWRLSGSFKEGHWYAGAIVSPDGSSTFKGSVNDAGNLVGDRDEKGPNGRRLLSLRADGVVEGRIVFNNGDSYKGTFRPDDLLPLKGVYRFASSGTTHTGLFGPDSQLDDGAIADPILMFPLPVSGGKIEGGDKPSPSSQGFIVATPVPPSLSFRLPEDATTRSGGD